MTNYYRQEQYLIQKIWKKNLNDWQQYMNTAEGVTRIIKPL